MKIGALARLAALLVLATAFTPAPVRVAHAQSLELAVKATYLYKFAPFVVWPASVFSSPTSPFNICVVGVHPFAAVLDEAVAGQQAGGHPIFVRRIDITDRTAGCHIAYVSDPDAGRIAEALRAARGAPVLTVTDGATVPAAKGIVNFIVVDNRVRFEINASAASSNNLEISSKLLSLAINARP